MGLYLANGTVVLPKEMKIVAKQYLGSTCVTCQCSKIKGTDQLYGYHTADLHLCFCICKKASFLMTHFICISIPDLYYMSLVMRKTAFCICEKKDADQLRGNREADQRLCFRYLDSTIALLPISEILSLQPSSVAVQPGLCWTWS